MKKTNQYSNKLTLTERLGVGFGISVLCIIALLIALLTNMTKPLPKTYLINFYDGDNLITTEQVNEDEVISNARLEEIANIALNDVTTIVKRYRDADSWLSNTTITEESYKNLENIMIDNDLLDDYVPFDELVINLND